MITNRKYYMQKALILLVFVLLSFNTNATEITNNEFAKRINKCVSSIYADKEQYPKHKQIPVELIIAQAAHESAWGKSRFAVEGNALFGVRTWDENVPHMKAKGAPDAEWGVRIYRSWCHSIKDYIDILERHPAYEQFREELEFQYKTQGNAEAITLVQYLGAWSEQGQQYIHLLQSIIQSLYQQDFFKKLT
jgi:Bax protein